MDKEIELEKSWFILAQIFIILAGFLFASGGIAWTNSINTLNTGINLANDYIQEGCKLNNLSGIAEFRNFSLYYYGQMTITNLELWKIFFLLGGIFLIISLVCWFLGYHKLKKLKEK